MEKKIKTNKFIERYNLKLYYKDYFYYLILIFFYNKNLLL